MKCLIAGKILSMRYSYSEPIIRLITTDHKKKVKQKLESFRVTPATSKTMPIVHTSSPIATPNLFKKVTQVSETG